ncbi:transposase [Mesorhizobium ventifaucium]|uniref:Transposase n=1 Tax=Mesorhizobium ventifaucium TaxID=666020 RepID=A0ABM9DEE5_9HYPH|nr:transposase [Mesorhizobium ventifaucium]
MLRRKPDAARRRGAPADPGRTGKAERYDYEYRRNGTTNLLVFLDAHRPWRKVTVTERRAADFAHCMRDLADGHYPEAACIRVVLDNLSTHTPAALYQALPPSKRDASCNGWCSTRRPSCQLAQHGRDRDSRPAQSVPRPPHRNRDSLVAEVAAWVNQRNNSGARINWMFSTEQAGELLSCFRRFMQIRETKCAWLHVVCS